MIFMIFKRSFGDFSYKTITQGLVLPICESWGTETANSENFVCFSLVFKHFASGTYKTQPWDISSILMHIWVFLFVFCSSDKTKMMSIYTLIIPAVGLWNTADNAKLGIYFGS